MLSEHVVAAAAVAAAAAAAVRKVHTVLLYAFKYSLFSDAGSVSLHIAWTC